MYYIKAKVKRFGKPQMYTYKKENSPFHLWNYLINEYGHVYYMVVYLNGVQINLHTMSNPPYLRLYA